MNVFLVFFSHCCLLYNYIGYVVWKHIVCWQLLKPGITEQQYLCSFVKVVHV